MCAGEARALPPRLRFANVLNRAGTGAKASAPASVRLRLSPASPGLSLRPSDLGLDGGRSGFAPATKNQAAQREAQPEGADGEAADCEGLAPGREPLPATERLALFRRQRFASALLPDRAARPETEVEVVENLGRLFGHAGHNIASIGCAYTCFTPVRPPLRSRERRGDRARDTGTDRALPAGARDRQRGSQPPGPGGPARPFLHFPQISRSPCPGGPRESRHSVQVPGALHPAVPRVRATVGDHRADLLLSHAARRRPELRAPVAPSVRRDPQQPACTRQRPAWNGTGRGIPDRRSASPPHRRPLALAEEACCATQSRARVTGERGRRPDPGGTHPSGRGERATRVRDLPWG